MKVLHSILPELNEQVHMCHTPRVLRGYIQCALEVNNTSAKKRSKSVNHYMLVRDLFDA